MKLVSNLFTKAAIIAMSAAAISACDSDDGGDTNPTTPVDTTMKVTVEYTDIKMSSENSLHQVLVSNATGTAMLKVVNDTTLEYTIDLTGVDASDTLTAAHIHSGMVNETGGPVITLASSRADFTTNSKLTGTVAIDATEGVSLKDEGMKYYVNVHSVKNPAGVARAQVMDGSYKLTRKIDLAATPGSRSETGVASMFVMDDNMLYYHAMVNGLLATDSITMAHIHLEDVGSDNGGVWVTLANDNASDAFPDIMTNMFKGSMQLTGGQVSDTLAKTTAGDPETYVNIHSRDFPSGLIRGDLQP